MIDNIPDMGEFDPAAWELFLRKMIGFNFKVFGISQRSADSSENNDGSLKKLCLWNGTQNGLHSMMEFQKKMKKLTEESRSQFQFEHEMK